MALVKVKGKNCLQYEKAEYTSSSPAFEMDDDTARQLAEAGMVELVDGEVLDGDADEEEEGEEEEYALFDLPSVTGSLSGVLTAAGIDSPAAVLNASESALVALKGIGKATARRLQAEAAELLQG